MNFFKRRNILKKLNYLDATPVRKCDFTVNSDNTITLQVPRFKNAKINRILLHERKRYYRITLDENGSTVWSKIDGIKKVADICSESLELLGDKIQPVEQRVTRFMTMLYDARYISFREIED